MKKFAQIGLGVCTIAASNLLMADCPRNMPEQLLEDCIVYEGSGSSFPTSDYAHMDEYRKWLKKQLPGKPAGSIPSTSVVKAGVN